MSGGLWVVMPVYNEQECIRAVLEEWVPVLRQTAAKFTLCVLNDGSKDDTLAILRKLATEIPELQVVDKPNSGHGQTCIHGYKMALAAGAEWVLQIDSDGQCEARFFPEFWSQREENPVVYGYRKKRGDGVARFLISRVVSAVTLAGTGTWVKDANVPYRLMRADTLNGLVDEVPKDFHLANILFAALQQERFGIRWVDIHFRQRIGGTPSVKAYSFGKQGFKLLRQLRNRHQLQAPAPEFAASKSPQLSQ